MSMEAAEIEPGSGALSSSRRAAVTRQRRPQSHAAANRPAEEAHGEALIPNRNIWPRRQRTAVVRTASPRGGLRFEFAETLPQNRAKPRGLGDDWRSALVSLERDRLNGGESGIRTSSTDLLSPALHWGESTANPNRPTWQQRQTPTAASSNPGTRGLRFVFARALAQNPAESREFLGLFLDAGAKSLQQQTEWQRE